MWPSTSTSTTPSLWSAHRPLLVNDPPTRMIARPRPKPRPVETSTRARRSAPPRQLVGCALTFGIPFVPQVAKAFSNKRVPEFDGAEVIIAPGALDRSLRRIAAGREVCRLQFGHDSELVFADTTSGLSIWIEDDTLMFSLEPRCLGGRTITTIVARTPSLRELSCGLLMRERIVGRSATGTRILVTRATLTEISLVARGACPETWVITC